MDYDKDPDDNKCSFYQDECFDINFYILYLTVHFTCLKRKKTHGHKQSNLNIVIKVLLERTVY